MSRNAYQDICTPVEVHVPQWSRALQHRLDNYILTMAGGFGAMFGTVKLYILQGIIQRIVVQLMWVGPTRFCVCSGRGILSMRGTIHGKEVLIATSHLESPLGWKVTSSGERTAQAKKVGRPARPWLACC